MAVYDRWHRDPGDGERPCEHSRGRNKLYPSAVHLKGKRWQVQWEDPHAPGRKRLKKNFDLRDPGPGELPDPDRHASAFDALMQGSIVTRTYQDPNAGTETLREYAETWRATRAHSDEAARSLAARLRNHVYEDPRKPGSGRAPRGAQSIGQHSMRLLADRPTLAAAWVTSLKGPLPAERSRAQVVDDLTAVFDAAIQDGVISKGNPLRAKVVDRPGRGGPKAQPYTAEEVEGIRAELPRRFQVLADMGQGIGAREMELAALAAGDFQFLGKRPRVHVQRQIKRVGGRLVFAPLKNRKPHYVPLSPLLAGRIARHLELYPAAAVTLPWHEPGSKAHGQPLTVRLVLTREDGTALARSSVQGHWRTAVGRYLARETPGRRRRERHTGWNPHRLRHTFASALLRKGVDVARVAAWMGDTIEMVTKTYLHLMRDDEDGEAEGRAAVDDLFSEGARAPGVPSEGDQGTSGQASGG